MFWIWRGIRGGLYPALRMFLVFLIALLITVNYYEGLIPLVGAIGRKSGLTARVCISLVATFFITLGVLVYLCFRLTSDKMALATWVDIIGGAIFGAGTGIVCSGALLMLWFTLPLAGGDFAVDDSELFFPAHTLAMRVAGFMGDRIHGGRLFQGDRFVRDVRYGLPQFGSTGSGIYVSSIPTGLRVYFQATVTGEYQGRRWGNSEQEFARKLKERMGPGGEDIPPSERKRGPEYKGCTPLFIPTKARVALVGVIMDDVPTEVTAGSQEAKDFFVCDNDKGVFAATTASPNYKPFVKVYEVSKEDENVGSVIALFQPRPEPFDSPVAWENAWDEVETLLPLRQCFPFDSAAAAQELLDRGAAPTEVKEGDLDGRLLRHLKHGGKVCFRGTGGVYVAEFNAAGQNIKTLPVADESVDLSEDAKSKAPPAPPQERGRETTPADARDMMQPER